MCQRTLSGPCSFEGKGLHTGKFSQITINPAPADTGIIFVRQDTGAEIPARADHISATRRSTSIGVTSSQSSSVRTIT